MGMGMRMGTGSCVESGEERKNHSLCAPWLPFRNETTVLLAYNLDNAPVRNDSDMPDGLHTAHPCKEQPYNSAPRTQNPDFAKSQCTKSRD